MPSELSGRSAVNEIPPFGKLFTLALQHVLTMYAGAITVPLLVASSLHLSGADTAYLVSADLFACGLVTLVQCLGIGPVGARLPVIMGVTFVGVMPSIAIASQPGLGLAGVYGAAIAAGFIVLPLVPLAGKLRSILTPSVTGTAMLLIGLSLMGVAIDWAAGGRGARITARRVICLFRGSRLRPSLPSPVMAIASWPIVPSLPVWCSAISWRYLWALSAPTRSAGRRPFN
jgi:NCS2 family nucleobase:cation symporter-2